MSITIKSIFNTMNETATDINSENFLILLKILYLDMYIGVKIITNPNRTDMQGIRNQLPFEYIQHTPKRIQRAKYIESGIRINLCFFINLGKFVNVNASNNAASTIQNQDNVLLIAKLQIKQGINAVA